MASAKAQPREGFDLQSIAKASDLLRLCLDGKHTANISSIPPASDLVRTHLRSYATQVKWTCDYIFAITPIGGGWF